MRISESALAYLRNESSFCSNRGDVVRNGTGAGANKMELLQTLEKCDIILNSTTGVEISLPEAIPPKAKTTREGFPEMGRRQYGWHGAHV